MEPSNHGIILENTKATIGQWSRLAVMSSALGLLAMVLSPSYALTCPTKLSKTADNTWHSTTYPGWSNSKKVAPDLVVDGFAFDEALYSYKSHKLACVYKTNSKKQPWLALTTPGNSRIMPDLNALNRKTLKPVWQYNTQHHDYSCTLSRQDCIYTIEEVKD